MNLKKDAIATSFKYGLSLSILSVLLFITLYFSGTEPFMNLETPDFFLFPLFIFVCLKEFRDYKNNQVLGISDALSVGVMMSLIAALLSSLFIFIFSELTPGYLDSYISEAIKLLQENKDATIESIGESSFNEAIESINNTSSIDLSVTDFLKKLSKGVFFTLIMMIILRKQAQ